MKEATGHNLQNNRERGQTVIILFAVVAFVITGVLTFLKFYTSYIDETLYEERLSQMSEVTTQLFSGLEDVIRNQWRTVDEKSRFLQEQDPQTLEELTDVMEKQYELADLEAVQCSLVAVDENGSYYTQNGAQGLLQERNYLSTSG